MKLLKFIPIIFVISGCQAWVTPISDGASDGDAWIFVEKPAGDLERNGIYRCSAKSGSTVCQKAKIRN